MHHYLTSIPNKWGKTSLVEAWRLLDRNVKVVLSQPNLHPSMSHEMDNSLPQLRTFVSMINLLRFVVIISTFINIQVAPTVGVFIAAHMSTTC